MKLVFLDADTLGMDIDLTIFDIFGDVKIYGYTAPHEVVSRIQEVDVIITNKVILDEDRLKYAKSLKLICLTATGTNNIDLNYAKSHGIGVANVAGYSTESVAQHTFAVLFYLLEKLSYYDQYVKGGTYTEDIQFTHFGRTFHQLKDKTWGIIGLGNIGRRVAEIAMAFGCSIQYYSTSGQNNNTYYKRVDLETLLTKSDIVSIHAPLNANTMGLIGYEELKKMKTDAFLLNLGRGKIVNEKDLVQALKEGRISGAALDVLEHEPINKDNPLLTIQDSTKLLITPHIAWASIESRQTLINEVYQNIEAFNTNEKRNRVI